MTSNKTTRMFTVKRLVVVSIIVVLAIGGYSGWKSFMEEYYPIHVDPSEHWEPFTQSLNADQTSFFVVSDGLQLEADLFIPNGGREQKPAIVFAVGSSDSLYQNYAEGFVEYYLLDFFLERDIAVLLINKRGMGQSEGNYTYNSIQGRADDVYAGVQALQVHPSIDATQIGVVGHSQGGWVSLLVASQHPDVAFYISLAGPTVTMYENAEDNYRNFAHCNGLEGQEVEDYVTQRLESVQLSIRIGEITNFGMFGFDARNMAYDPANALMTATQPGLLLFAEHDNLVTPSLNLDRLDIIFDGDVPERISTYTLSRVNHVFQIVSDMCAPHNPNLTPEYFEVLSTWLDEYFQTSQ